MAKSGGSYTNIIITQFLCVAVVLLSVLTTKYFFKSEFKSLKKWYTAEICDDTRIEEVIG